jgi:hypothetical protein
MLGHKDRDVLFDFAMRIEQAREPLEDGLLPIPVVEADNCFVFSSDLSRATDTVSHDIVNILVRELALQEIVVKHCFPDKTPWLRGIPMGMPASWSILTLTHAFVAFKVDSSGSFRIKGDDLIAYWTKAQINQYIDLIENLGYIVKRKCSYIHPTRGLFCENPYELRHSELIPLEGYFSFKFLSANTAEFDLPSIARRLHGLVDEGVPREVVCNIQSMYLRKQIRLCRQMSVDPYVPAFFGGMGLVPKYPDKSPSVQYQRIAKRLVSKPFDYRARLVLESYPKNSLQFAVARDVARYTRHMMYGFDRATDLVLCEDKFSKALVEPLTYFHMKWRQPGEPNLSRYLKAVKRTFTSLRRSSEAWAVNYRYNYRQLYDLESRVGAVKGVHDAINQYRPTEKQATELREELDRLRDEARVSRIKRFLMHWDEDSLSAISRV